MTDELLPSEPRDPSRALRALGQLVAETQDAELLRKGVALEALERFRSRDAVEERRARGSRGGLRAFFASRRPRPLVAALLAATLSIAIAALFVVRRFPSPSAWVEGGTQVGVGDFVRADDGPALMHFTDGTTISISPRSRGRLIALDRSGGEVAIEDGRASVAVPPHQGRAWTIDAGPYRVLVTGTRFDVGWDESARRFDLVMFEGRVEVRGPNTSAVTVVAGEHLSLEPSTVARADGLGRASGPSGALGAGASPSGGARAGSPRVGAEGSNAEGLDPATPSPGEPSAAGSSAAGASAAGASSAGSSSAGASSAGASSVGPSSVGPREGDRIVDRASAGSEGRGGSTSPEPSGRAPTAPPPTAPPPTAKGWRALAREAHFKEAVEAAEALGYDAVCASANAKDLLMLADAARLASKGDRARTAYAAVRSRHAGSDEAARAAFALGVMAFPSDSALPLLEEYLTSAPAGPLAPEALGRILEIRHRSGDTAGARSAAEQYLASYPNGAHAKLAKSILARP